MAIDSAILNALANNIKAYVDNKTLTKVENTDFQELREIVENLSTDYNDLTNKPDLKPVATSGDYNDLTNKPELATVATSGSYNDLTDKPTIVGAVTMATAQTPDVGYAATYIISQDNNEIGRINIPKDYLVKSAELKTATANDLNTLGVGYAEGDKYIDFVVNTSDNSGTAQHMYINVKDLVDEYDGDNVTIVLNNGVFSVKDGSIGTTQLTSELNTTINSKVTIDEVDDEINDVLDALADAFALTYTVSVSISMSQSVVDKINQLNEEGNPAIMYIDNNSVRDLIINDIITNCNFGETNEENESVETFDILLTGGNHTIIYNGFNLNGRTNEYTFHVSPTQEEQNVTVNITIAEVANTR